MPKSLRAFIAIPIPEPVTAFMQQIQSQLQARRLDCRWPAAENIHLTLKFLGDIEPTQVIDIADRMDAIATRHPPFWLRTGGVGAFPNLRRARVLWVGLAGDVDRLRHLQTALDSGLAADGFDRASRDFRPHLTVGRSRRRIQANAIEKALASLQDLAADPFRVNQMVLFQSILKPSGAAYKRLHSTRLAD